MASDMRAWTASDGPIQVVVDKATFAYHVELDGHLWFSSGIVSFMCGGKSWGSEPGAGLVGGDISTTEEVDTRSIQRTWAAGTCGSVSTIIREYKSGGIEFLSVVGSGGLNGTATCMKTGPSCPSTATGFPNLLLPTNHSLPTGYASWCAGGCGAGGSSTLHLGTPVEPPPTVDWSKFGGGGLHGGPLVTYSAANGSATVLGPSRSFKSGVMVRTPQGTRLVAGAHGMLRSLPPHYTLGFAMRARRDGVSAAMLAYGALLRRLATASEPWLSRKLHLGVDVLSRQLHYVTDGGSLLNYCDYWPKCVSDPSAPCRPEGQTLHDVAAYHRAIGLDVGVYHVDPYWYSHTANGGCDDFLARNWSASPFHWPRGLGAAKLPMMLFLGEFAGCAKGGAEGGGVKGGGAKGGAKGGGAEGGAEGGDKDGDMDGAKEGANGSAAEGGRPTNVYCADYHFAGTSVAGADAERFFRARFRENGARAARGEESPRGRAAEPPAVFRALTLDNVQSVWWSDPERLTDAREQEAYDRGLAAAAMAYELPIRVDQQLPGDVLASTLYGARVAARCTLDTGPSGGYTERVRWRQLAASSLLHRAVGMRPMVDVLWTSANQSDPRWKAGTICRPNLLYDLATAVLSTGPVGFGDLINGTNASLLLRATRAPGDGTLLKPASAALPINRYYAAAPVGGAVITIAPTRPAASVDPSKDTVANSMARLLRDDGDDETDETDEHGRPWGWLVLSTNVDARQSSGAPLDVDELWPRPVAGTRFFVTFPASTGSQASPTAACVDGAPAASCTRLWDAARPLEVGTAGPTGTHQCPIHQFVLAAAAPVLRSGWTLLGDLRKLVPLSPQRFVVATADAGSATYLRFRVLGRAGDAVPVTLLTPAAVVRVVHVSVGAQGSMLVSCGANATRPPDTCEVHGEVGTST